MDQQNTSEELGKLVHQLKFLAGGAVLLFLVPLIVYGYLLEQRITEFENNLRFSPPQELESDNEASAAHDTQVVVNSVLGQLVYVPAYSHVYQSESKPYLLTVTLSVRNTSVDAPITLKSVRYYNTKGRLVRAYLEAPVRLPPLGTTEVVVEREDASGGSGANFLVEWTASSPVNEPIIEAVMIDTKSQQGIAFVCAGKVIKETRSELQSTD